MKKVASGEFSKTKLDFDIKHHIHNCGFFTQDVRKIKKTTTKILNKEKQIKEYELG